MRTIILNSSNLVQDGQNNKLVYRFPNSVQFKDSYIALSQAQMYYSWFNITSPLGNNTFSYVWYNAAMVPTTYTVVIPNGLYEIVTLNQFLQYTFIQNGHYLVNASGENVYYAEFLVNPSRYAIQINTFQFPTVLPLGWTNPAAVPLPAQTFNPSLTIPSKLTQILGFLVATTTDPNINNAYVPPVSDYISKNAVGTLSYLSTTSPNVQPNSSIILNISNIDNQYAQPTGTIYSIVPSVGIGQIINDKPPNFSFIKLIPGTYNELRLSILGTDLSPITLRDPNMTFILVIKDNESKY